MKDLILFSIEKNNFSLELDKIKRIVQASKTTPVAGNADEIEGIFTFEDKVLNVLDFRTMIGIEQFDERYNEMIPKFKKEQDDWIEALENSVKENVPFTKSINTNESELGKWLGSFTSYDDTMTNILADLSSALKQFYGKATAIINMTKRDKERASNMLLTEVQPLRETIARCLDVLLADKQLISNSTQKFLIIDGEKPFAVRIDEVDDIIAIDESDIQSADSFDEDSTLVKINGIFEYQEKLVNLIDSITIPKVKGT